MIEIIPNWHPLLVHFTVALWSVAVGLFVVGRLFHGTDLGENSKIVALYSLWLGAFFSVFTGLAGWDAYNTVAHDDASHAAMTEHRNWALATLAVFFVLSLWAAVSRSVRRQPSAPFLVVALLGLALLMTTGYKGAEVVYRYGLGVMSLPEAEAGGHAHAHDDGGHGDPAGDADMTMPEDMDIEQDAHEDGHTHGEGHAH